MTSVVAIGVVLALCVAGSATAYLVYRQRTAPAPSESPSPSPARTPGPPQPSAQPGTSGPDCLVGVWVEVSVSSWANIYGTRVQLIGKGAVASFGADGVHRALFDNLVRAGTAAGDNYEVIHNGKAQTNYTVDATTVYYSNPVTEGQTTWKINGRVRTSEQFRLTLAPDTYKCQGNDLRLFSEDYAAEFKRIVPPGTPV
jgi:hypothetical protein